MFSSFRTWFIGWTVLLAVAIGLVFVVPDGVKPFLFAGAPAFYLAAVGVTWLLLRERQPKYDTRLPMRPQVSAQGVEALVRMHEPRAAPPPRATPAALSHASLDVTELRRDEPVVVEVEGPETAEETDEPQDEDQEEPVPAPALVEPPPPPAPTPAGFEFRGFTLYERKGSNGPVRLFSRSKPVGGGVPIGLPAGAEVRWDAKRGRPVLAWPEPAAAEAAPEPPASPAPSAPAPPASNLRPRARPCSAIVDLGEFCDEDAVEGGAFCRKHAATKGKAAPEIEVVHDRADGRLKPLRLGASKIEVVQDRGVHATKPLKVRPAKLVVEQDRGEVKPAKAVKPREVRLVVERDRAQAKPVKPIKARETKVVVATGRGAPPTAPSKGRKGKRVEDPFAEQEAAEARARKALAAGAPTGTLKIPPANVVVSKDKRPAKTPKPLKVPEPSLIVLDTRDATGPGTLKVAQPRFVLESPGRAAKPPKPMKVVEAKIVAPKPKPIVGFKLKGQDDFDVVSPRGDLVAVQRKGKPGRCVATVDGKRCVNTARQGMGTCASHAGWRATTELEIRKDSKSRGAIDEDPKKRRGAKG